MRTEKRRVIAGVYPMQNPEIVPESDSQLSTDISRRSRIIALATSAQYGAKDVRDRQRRCIEEAIECGRLLLDEKHLNASKGKWADYFQIHFGSVISDRTGRLWMALARKHADNPALPEPNLMRNGILALDLMPEKVHPTQPKELTIVIRNNHMAPIMRVEAWIRQFDGQSRSMKSAAYLRQLCKDFSKVSAFINRLQASVKAQ